MSRIGDASARELTRSRSPSARLRVSASKLQSRLIFGAFLPRQQAAKIAEEMESLPTLLKCAFPAPCGGCAYCSYKLPDSALQETLTDAGVELSHEQTARLWKWLTRQAPASLQRRLDGCVEERAREIPASARRLRKDLIFGAFLPWGVAHEIAERLKSLPELLQCAFPSPCCDCSICTLSGAQPHGRLQERLTAAGVQLPNEMLKRLWFWLVEKAPNYHGLPLLMAECTEEKWYFHNLTRNAGLSPTEAQTLVTETVTLDSLLALLCPNINANSMWTVDVEKYAESMLAQLVDPPITGATWDSFLAWLKVECCKR